MLFWSVYFYNKVLNEGSWHFQLCSFSEFFSYSDSCVVPYKFLKFILLFLWKCHRNFEKDWIESIDSFGYYEYFDNVNSFNPWTWDIFQFIFFLIFFYQLVKVITKYFFDVIVKGIVFLTSFSDSSLLVCRNTTHFCILILYP